MIAAVYVHRPMMADDLSPLGYTLLMLYPVEGYFLCVVQRDRIDGFDSVFADLKPWSPFLYRQLINGGVLG